MSDSLDWLRYVCKAGAGAAVVVVATGLLYMYSYREAELRESERKTIFNQLPISLVGYGLLSFFHFLVSFSSLINKRENKKKQGWKKKNWSLAAATAVIGSRPNAYITSIRLDMIGNGRAFQMVENALVHSLAFLLDSAPLCVRVCARKGQLYNSLSSSGGRLPVHSRSIQELLTVKAI